MDADGNLKFDPSNLRDGILQANKAGVVSDDAVKDLMPQAQAVEDAHAELIKAAGGNTEAKAAIEGLTKGGIGAAGFWGGAIAGAGIGAAVPFIGETGLSELAGGLIGGILSVSAANKVERQLAKYSDAVKSFQAAATLHPYIAGGTQIAANLVGGPASLSNLAGLAEVGGTKAVAAQLGRGALAGAGAELIARPAIQHTQDIVADALGIEHDPTEAPTAGSILQNALFGAVLSGHGLQDTAPNQETLANIAQRGLARETNVGPDGKPQPIPLGAQFSNIVADAQNAPLSLSEQALYSQLKQAANKYGAPLGDLLSGQNPNTATARQITTKGGTPLATTAEIGARPDLPQTPAPEVPPVAQPPVQPAPVAPANPLGAEAKALQDILARGSFESRTPLNPTSIAALQGRLAEIQAQVKTSPAAPGIPNLPGPAGVPSSPVSPSALVPTQNPLVTTDNLAPSPTQTTPSASLSPDIESPSGTRLSNTLSPSPNPVTPSPELQGLQQTAIGIQNVVNGEQYPDWVRQAAKGELDKVNAQISALQSAPTAPAPGGTGQPSPASPSGEPPATASTNVQGDAGSTQTGTASSNPPAIPGLEGPSVSDPASPVAKPATTERATRSLDQSRPPTGQELPSPEPSTSTPSDNEQVTTQPTQTGGAQATETGSTPAEEVGTPRNPRVATDEPGTGIPGLAEPAGERTLANNPDASSTNSTREQGTSANTSPQEKAASSGSGGAGSTGTEVPVPERGQSSSESGPRPRFSGQRIRSGISVGDSRRAVEEAHAPFADIAPLEERQLSIPEKRVSVPRQTQEREIPNESGTGTKTIPPDSDNAAKAREFIGTERGEGRTPTPRELSVKFAIPPATSSRLIADQKQAEWEAGQRAAGAGILYDEGSHTIQHDPVAMADTMRSFAARGLDGPAFVKSSVQEEVFHHLDTLASEEEGGVGKSRAAIADAMTPGMVNATLATYGEPQTPEFFKNDPKATEQFRRKFLAAEYVRALAQRRAGTPLTESHYKDTSALEAVLDGPQPEVVEKHLAAMQRLAPQSGVESRNNQGSSAHPLSNPPTSAGPSGEHAPPSSPPATTESQEARNNGNLRTLHPDELMIDDAGLSRVRDLETKVQDALSRHGIENPGDFMEDEIWSRGRTTNEQYEEGLKGFLAYLNRHRSLTEDSIVKALQNGETVAPPTPFKRPSNAEVQKQAQLTRALEKSVGRNPAARKMAEKARAKLTELQNAKNAPLQEGEKPRTFSLPSGPHGVSDVLDHIQAEGKIAPPTKAPEYDDAPDLKGIYRHSVYGGTVKPDDMAQQLHDNYGVGDGSVGGMWSAISNAIAARKKARENDQRESTAQKQAGRFEKDALQPGKGKKQVHAGNLSVGDTVTVGDQKLKVKSVDPDLETVELEDHSKYGIQTVSDGTALYVERVQKAKPLPANDEPTVDTSTSDNLKTRLDLILDGVEKHGEVSLHIEGNISREQVMKVSDTATARGMSAAYDGHGFLIRKVQKAKSPSEPQQTEDNQALPKTESSVPEPERAQGSTGSAAPYSPQDKTRGSTDDEKSTVSESSPDFTLESPTGKQLDAEAEKKRQREKLAEGQAKRLSTKELDTTPDMLDPEKADNPLFANAKPADTKKVAPTISPAASKALEDAFSGLFAANPLQTDTPAFKDWFGDSKLVDESGSPQQFHSGYAGQIRSSVYRLGARNPRLQNKGDSNQFGFFFSPDIITAAHYADTGTARRGTIKSVYLKSDNPLDFSRSRPAQAMGHYPQWLPDMASFLQERGVTLPASISEDALRQTWEENGGTNFSEDLQPFALFDGSRAGEVREAIVRAGYDSVIFPEWQHRGNIWDNNGPTSQRLYKKENAVAVFGSNQIKSATANNGEFDPNNPSILRASNPLAQQPLPPDKIAPFVSAAQALLASGVDTPEAMAAVLDSKFQGKARPYSEALWDAMGMVNKELRGSHDWPALYAKRDQDNSSHSSTAAGVVPNPQEPQKKDQPQSSSPSQSGVASKPGASIRPESRPSSDVDTATDTAQGERNVVGAGMAQADAPVGSSPTPQQQPSSTDDRNSRRHLEPDRPDAGTGERGSEDQLPVQRGATGEDGERVDAVAGESESGTASGPLSADVPSAPHRESGDSGVREPAPGTEQRPAGNERLAGSGRPDAGGVRGQERYDAATPASTFGATASLAQDLAPSSPDSGSASARQAEDGWHPSLTPEQVGDGKFIERRLYENDKPGVLLTNGTGTGKTFSGLGAVKRRLDAGENHILIVAPSDKIGGDWVDTAKQFFGIPDIAQLENTKDSAETHRVAVTTYANLAQNASLVSRPWGMLVADEAHYLSQAQDGKGTDALDAFRALTLHPQGIYRRAEMMEPDATATLQKLRSIETGKLTNEQRGEREVANNKLKAAREKIKTAMDAPDAPKPKALMLSATPFAYHKNLAYADGYLFDSPEDRGDGGYNQAKGFDKFLQDNLGYRMRTGKLNVPENATATGILERRLAEKLMKDGAMAGRALQVEHDYSRDFVQTDNQLGHKVDEIMSTIQKDPKLRPLLNYMGVGDYLQRRFLLESLKAQDAIPRIQKHLAMGRKVVVFHDYKKGGATNPLRSTHPRGATEYVNEVGGKVNLDESYRTLAEKVPGFQDVVDALDSLQSPIEAFQKEIANAPRRTTDPTPERTSVYPQPSDSSVPSPHPTSKLAIFNGDVSKGDRRKAVDAFNKSEDTNVILVQRASGKEGISLHDRDGKHQRVFMDLGIPGRPTDAIQSEGRIYRHGVKSNAIVEYLTTGTNFERWTFAQTIAQRASTAENLAMGERARNLLQSFASGYNEAEAGQPSKSQGTGGKAKDQALENGDPYKNAEALYYTNQKKTQRDKAREGLDYFPTPEPLAYKMVQWADIKPGESVLEPSAGHGAIARFFPDAVNKTGIEPSNELASRLALNAPDIDIKQQRFEDHHISNKYNAIVMNAPFGTAGRTVVDHIIKAAGHLRDGGRIVALLPEGSATDKFNKWLDTADGIYQTAEFGLPPVTFERAATQVKARIVVLDKAVAAKSGDASSKLAGVPNAQPRQEFPAESVKELFERIADVQVPPRAPASRNNGQETPTTPQPLNPSAQKARTPHPKSQSVSSPTSTIPTPKRDSNFSPADFLHTKDQTPVFVAKAERRFSPEEYKAQSARAKQNGGHYSNYSSGGAIPGFHFKTAEARDSFIGQKESAKPTFAEQAARAAVSVPLSQRFGQHKASISATFDAYKNNGGELDLPAFKAQLIKEQTAGNLLLSRADLADPSKAAIIQRSKAEYLGETFHAIRTDQGKAMEGQQLRAANPLRSFYDQAADEYQSLDQKDRIKAGYDAANNTAEYYGEQVLNKIKLDLPDKADREAMPFVIEAGGDASKLQGERAKIAASVDPKLATKFLPIIDHAIANFPRLQKARANHDRIMAESIKELKAAGVDVGEVENYVTRKLDQPDAKKDVLPNPLFSMGGGTGSSPRYFTKGRAFETLADAIQAGYPPKGTDLADLDRHRIVAAKRILEQKNFINRLKQTPSPTDGKPIVGKFETRTPLNGETERVTPQGYTAVRTGAGEVPIHNQFAHLFKDLYGDSAARRLTAFRALMKAAALGKQYTLLLDTFHIGRLLYKMATAGGGAPVTFKNGKPQFNIRHGLALIQYDDADLARAVSAGEISQSDADYAKAMRPQAEELLAAGLNVGRVADNLVQQAHVHVPGLAGFNDWIFGKLSRAAMIQTALTGYKRNKANFPERTDEQNARQTAKECNELFGNLQNQGMFTNKTFQDLCRLIFLAPQWTESQLRYEGRAYGQFARGVYDAIRGGGGGKGAGGGKGGSGGPGSPIGPQGTPGSGKAGKRFRLGNAARAMAAGLVALFAVNQFINLLSRHQFTWDNEEDGHKLDAFIPGGKRGFWFNPFEIAGEYAHAAFKYAAQHENPVDIASHVLSNKLSPIARGAKDIIGGRDYAGRPYLNNEDRFRAGIVDALPSPIPLGGVLEKDPRQALGYRLNRQPGSLEKQALASVGLKTANAQSPRNEMYALASPFRPDRVGTDVAGPYNELKRALNNDQESSTQDEVKTLLSQGRSIATIERAVGIQRDKIDPSKFAVKPIQFAGSADDEKRFVASLTPHEEETYAAAQRENIEDAQKFLQYTSNLLRDDPDTRRLAAINAAGEKAKAQANKTARASVAPAPKLTGPPSFAGFNT